MKIVALVIPALFLFSFVYAAAKKVNVYETFVGGVKKAPPLILSVFPYIAAIMMLSTLFEKSGLSAALSEKSFSASSRLGRQIRNLSVKSSRQCCFFSQWLRSSTP